MSHTLWMLLGQKQRTSAAISKNPCPDRHGAALGPGWFYSSSIWADKWIWTPFSSFLMNLSMFHFSKVLPAVFLWVCLGFSTIKPQKLLTQWLLHQQMLTFYFSLEWEGIKEFQHSPTKWNCCFLNSSNQPLRTLSHFHPSRTMQVYRFSSCMKGLWDHSFQELM